MVGLIYSIQLGFKLGSIEINITHIIMLLVIIYYVKLSKTLFVGMLIFSGLCLLLCKYFTSSSPIVLWQLSLIIFAAAWVAQFYGHKVEGKKLSFLKDLQFLLIGPTWQMSFVYKKIGIPL